MAKDLCCILTDDMFLYNGIKDLCPDIHLLRESLAGDVLAENVSKKIMAVIIDGRVLLGGKWNGYEKLTSENPDANVIWALHRSVCGFFRCENYLSCICAHHNLDAFRAALMARIENKDSVKSSCGILSSYEKKLLPYFVDGISFEVMSKFFSCSEKTLHSHRLHITSKFGFRSALHMSAVFYRISPLLADKL